MAPIVPHPSYAYSLSPINGASCSKTRLFSSPPHKCKHPCTFKISSLAGEASPIGDGSGSSAGASGGDGPAVSDPLKLAFEKARAYKESKRLVQESAVGSPRVEDKGRGGDAVKIAMEKAKEYRKTKEVVGNVEVADLGIGDVEKQTLEGMNLPRDVSDNKMEKEKLKISNIDFIGLDFSEKKRSRGPPPGLVPISDPFADNNNIEVELILGDSSKLGDDMRPETIKEEDGLDLYKPKVSTWGVFPRPNDISKTFGGGRNIRPGEALESVKDKAAKEARTKELIVSYKNRMGLNIDAKTKAECEKALKEGDNLMDLGKLQEALPYYEKVMKAVTFKSELHGLAALQWSICQDSLSRPNEARVMYEKLQSHPNVQVSKKAKQFMFSFQAMEMMKVSMKSSKSRPTGYQGYFEAFVEDRGDYAMGLEEKNEDVMKEILPYLILLVAPIFLIVLIAARKSL